MRVLRTICRVKLTDCIKNVEVRREEERKKVAVENNKAPASVVRTCGKTEGRKNDKTDMQRDSGRILKPMKITIEFHAKIGCFLSVRKSNETSGSKRVCKERLVLEKLELVLTAFQYETNVVPLNLSLLLVS